MMGTIARLTELGQSLWLDNIQRKMLENGDIKAMIERGEIRGMTSNPAIFNHAISKSTDYDEALTCLAWAGWDAEKILWELVVEDIREAADLFTPLYEQTNGDDGYVSIEVSPFLARKAEATVAQAQQLWVRVARPNIMIKIPATPAGIPAIRRCIAAGININITLIFSRARYAEVMQAYLSGLEDRLSAGRPIGHIASVASFFVSRVDTKVDERLPAGSALRGKAAIANAKIAYADFLGIYAGDRWERLQAQGGRVQRPLWASTSTKNPAYPDTMYVDNLVGPATVNTLPPQTLDAFRDHGRAETTITRDVDQALATIGDLERVGISMATVTDELEAEGVTAFSEAITDLTKKIDGRRKGAVVGLGQIAEPVAMRINQLAADSVPTRFWTHDPTLWTKDPAGQAEVITRMGWMDSPQKARAQLSTYQGFAAQIRAAGIHEFLVLGMGGSSLSAEVLSQCFVPGASRAPAGPELHDGSPRLAILDSTDPAQVGAVAASFPPGEGLRVMASKSGATAEVTALLDYFWSVGRGDGSRFIAITDPATSLEGLARKLGFRKVFAADPSVGGRYSGLTDFGMLPAALLGIDLDRLLGRAEWIQRQCMREVPAARSPGFCLGAVLGEAVLAGRDKLTLLADPPLQALPNWIEQLVAESSGKDGRGIVPIALEPVDGPEVYGPDRLFVYLRQGGDYDESVEALRRAGHPALVLTLRDAYDVGAEFFRWEVAVATACHILGVNAFDQPDVQDSKDRTKAKIQEYRGSGQVVEGRWDVHAEGSAPSGQDSKRLIKFIEQAAPGQYFGVNAYLRRDPSTMEALQRLRVAIRERTRAAVMVGFGPRFQHSTGQLHKGGPNTGLFIQILCKTAQDLEIPNEGMTFGTLLRAQALGDFEALLARGRRVIRIQLSEPEDVRFLTEVIR
jgi:transaldolase/glucose-6-phosphate isomerase